MHPLIRLLALLLVALALPQLPLGDLALAGLAGLLAHAWFGRAGLRRVVDGLWRIRYLLAAIAILYLGMTPGEPAWDTLPGISREGLAEGSRRALVLVVLLIVVYLLLETTAAATLTAAMAQCLYPLRWIGVPVDRVARRAAMTLGAVPALQDRLRQGRAAGEGWRQVLTGTVQEIEQDRLLAAPEPVPRLSPPHPAQWLWLLAPLLMLVAWPR